MCVQNFNDSLSCAIRITYRSSQRSSSIHEPRDPPLKVVGFIFFFFRKKRFVRRNELKLYGFFSFFYQETGLEYKIDLKKCNISSHIKED
jgi:hypothetical protein